MRGTKSKGTCVKGRIHEEELRSSSCLSDRFCISYGVTHLTQPLHTGLGNEHRPGSTFLLLYMLGLTAHLMLKQNSSFLRSVPSTASTKNVHVSLKQFSALWEGYPLAPIRENERWTAPPYVSTWLLVRQQQVALIACVPICKEACCCLKIPHTEARRQERIGPGEDYLAHPKCWKPCLFAAHIRSGTFNINFRRRSLLPQRATINYASASSDRPEEVVSVGFAKDKKKAPVRSDIKHPSIKAV